jgi:tetratricopeptide (TPR) repeat protein
MRRRLIPALLLPALVAGCAARPDKSARTTLAELRNVAPDLAEARVEQGLDQAMESYRRFLEETPETAMTPEAMRRLADLEVEKQYGIRTGDGNPREMAAPGSSQSHPGPLEGTSRAGEPSGAGGTAGGDSAWESEEDFEQRTIAESGTLPVVGDHGWQGGEEGRSQEPSGPLEAIDLYERLLEEYPDYEHKDKVLYQMARAYDELGRTEEALETMERLIGTNSGSEHFDEVQFRRGEYFFTRRRFSDAESAYAAIIGMGAASSYYELALYKLGWTLYKQDFYEEALHRYMALLDYKVTIGYDFDQTQAEEDERRVADTYRVISLSFSNLGGPEAVREYFAGFGSRSYEDRVYANLGEHYRGKLRYDDAAKTYRAFVEMYPFHRAAPRFGMHLVETFTEGGFPKLVLEAKRDFASKYGLQSEYWSHFEPAESPDLLAYLKTNLKDLATHYHALYQGSEDEGEKLASYNEALRWYGDYLSSFPSDEESPAINFRLADLHLENENYGEAARQYERTAYDYPAHPKSADAGYAAVYAWREQLKTPEAPHWDDLKRSTIASSIRFVDTFPDHGSAAPILGAAADDLYELKAYREAIDSARRLIGSYPHADDVVWRSAWIVVAHGSFETEDYAQAEQAYTQVLMMTPDDDETLAGFIDNLAASIYKQGERAGVAEDYRAAADHFLRISEAAPTSTIRASAEYDAGAALMALQDWAAAADVFEAFRSAYPEHELRIEATRQIAFACKEDGQIARAAGEYDRLGSESGEPALRGEALLVAGDLYEQSDDPDRALSAYARYVDGFPAPVEAALETRYKMARIHEAELDEWLYHRELEEIVRIEAAAVAERTGRTRTIAARSALVLSERLYRGAVAVKLLQPFEVSLKEKKQGLDATIEAMGGLVEYEIADVTAAATYYMAEAYLDFSRALLDSERPADLEPEALEEYELAIEDEAFPFEEKAIAVHEKNIELMQAGVLCPWTGKSLAKLVELLPARYARSEMSIGLIGEIDSYVYRTPASLLYGPPEAPADGAPTASEARAARLRPVLNDRQEESHATPRH